MNAIVATHMAATIKQTMPNVFSTAEASTRAVATMPTLFIRYQRWSQSSRSWMSSALKSKSATRKQQLIRALRPHAWTQASVSQQVAALNANAKTKSTRERFVRRGTFVRRRPATTEPLVPTPLTASIAPAFHSGAASTADTDNTRPQRQKSQPERYIC